MISLNKFFLMILVGLLVIIPSSSQLLVPKPVRDSSVHQIKVDPSKFVEITINNGDTINASLNIEFKGGRDSLENYILSNYYNIKNYNKMDMDYLIHFFIIIDKNLMVYEVKIFRHPYGPYDKNELNLDQVFIDIIKRTDKKWERIDKNKKSEWYIYSIRMRVN